MENEKPLNQFEEVHKRVREARDRAREVQEKDAEARQERAEKEAVREGFDQSSALADTGSSHSRRVSVSGQPQFSRQHFSAILTTATRERTGSDCLTPVPLDSW